MKDFDKYSKENIHFLADQLFFLEDCIRASSPKTLVDLGCGDGATLFTLEIVELLNGVDVYGCDLSQERLNRLKKCLPNVSLICGDASNLNQLTDGYFDFVICSQVIEHVKDDEALLREIDRLLSPSGTIYISSVVKKWYGWWIYRNDGRVVCDPTHVREYSSKEEFVNLLVKNGFNPIKIAISHFKPSLVNAVGRILCKFGLTSKEAIDRLYLKSPLFNRVSRLFSMPVPGYFIVEVIAKKGNT